jgi:hypothetical protein
MRACALFNRSRASAKARTALQQSWLSQADLGFSCPAQCHPNTSGQSQHRTQAVPVSSHAADAADERYSRVPRASSAFADWHTIRHIVSRDYSPCKKAGIGEGRVMLRAAVICMAASTILVGCASARLEHASAEMTACKKQFPTGPQTNHVALARCTNDVAAKYWDDPLNRDLLNLVAAKRIAIATQVDQGKISEQEGDVLSAQAAADANSVLQQRKNASGLVAGQQAAAFGNSLQQAGAALQSIGPPPPQTMTCTSMPWGGPGGLRTTCQ